MLLCLLLMSRGMLVDTVKPNKISSVALHNLFLNKFFFYAINGLYFNNQ